MVTDIWTGNRYSFRTNLLKKKIKFFARDEIWHTYSNMPNLIVMFISCFKPKKKPFWLTWPKELKLPIKDEIWYLDQCKYNEVHFLFFGSNISFLGKFVPKYQNCLFKTKFGT